MAETLTLHLMTQRGQPYGSVRRCCERCGVMLVARPAEFWRENVWVDDPNGQQSALTALVRW